MGGDGEFDSLDEWVRESKVREAAGARSRERWLLQQGQEAAELLGVLADLVERAASVVVRVAGGREHRGRLGTVAHDFVAVHGASTHTTLVALDAISVVVPLHDPVGRERVAGEPRQTSSQSMAGVLSIMAGDRAHLRIGLRDGQTMAGELRAVGVDVLTLRVDAEPAGLAYVPLASIGDVSFLGSG